MKLTIDTKELTAIKNAAKNAKKKLENRHELHEDFKDYQRSRWLENLVGGGAIYGAYRELQDSTRRVRLWRGFASGPVLFQSGQMGTWVSAESDSPQLIIQPSLSSTLWQFEFSGSRDGSYAVLHDQGYTAGGAGAFASFNGKSVPQRIIFDLNDDDVETLMQLTGEYVDEALGGTL